MSSSHTLSYEIKPQKKDPVVSAYLKEIDTPLIQRLNCYLNSDTKSVDKRFSALMMHAKQYSNNPKSKTETDVRALISFLEKHHAGSKHLTITYRSQVVLGIAYLFGIGQSKNFLKAKHFFNNAAKANNAEALFCMGYLYLSGGVDYLFFNRNMIFEPYQFTAENIRHHVSCAQHYFEKSTSLGNSYSHTFLADTLDNPIYSIVGGIKQSKSKAKTHLEKAKELGNAEALNKVKEYRKSKIKLTLYEVKAASQGCARAMSLLGNNFLHIAKNYDKGIFYLRLSMLSGYDDNRLAFLEHKLILTPYVLYQISMALNNEDKLEDTFIDHPNAVFNAFMNDISYTDSSLAAQALTNMQKIILRESLNTIPEAHYLRMSIGIALCSQYNFEKGLPLLQALSPKYLNAEQNFIITNYLYPALGMKIAFPFLRRSAQLGSEEARRFLSNVARSETKTNGFETKTPEFTPAEQKSESFENYVRLREVRNTFFQRVNHDAEAISTHIQNIVDQYVDANAEDDELRYRRIMRRCII